MNEEGVFLQAKWINLTQNEHSGIIESVFTLKNTSYLKSVHTSMLDGYTQLPREDFLDERILLRAV